MVDPHPKNRGTCRLNQATMKVFLLQQRRGRLQEPPKECYLLPAVIPPTDYGTLCTPIL